MNIDFGKVPCYIGARRIGKREVDLRETLANALYCRAAGALAGKVALKIVDQRGALDFTPQEVSVIRQHVQNFYSRGEVFSPAMYDGIMSVLSGKQEPLRTINTLTQTQNVNKD